MSYYVTCPFCDTHLGSGACCDCRNPSQLNENGAVLANYIANTHGYAEGRTPVLRRSFVHLRGYTMKALCELLPPVLVFALCILADGLMETLGPLPFLILTGIVGTFCVALQHIIKRKALPCEPASNTEKD